jgi:hypothetical protein
MAIEDEFFGNLGLSLDDELGPELARHVRERGYTWPPSVWARCSSPVRPCLDRSRLELCRGSSFPPDRPVHLRRRNRP